MKKIFAISAPVDSHSGYGAKSRDIVNAIIALDIYDVKIINQCWGSTPSGYLNEDHEEIKKRLVKNLQEKPDIWAQITIPSEFQRVGNYNILFTSGIETDLAPSDFIEGCNRADLVIVPSQFTKDTLMNTAFERREQGSNKPVGKIQIETNIEVLMEGLDTTRYFNTSTSDFELLDNINEKFCFLYTSHWLNGELGEDRKDASGLVKTFLETFKNIPNKPALIMKTSAAAYSIMDRDLIVSRIEAIKKLVTGDLPKIYLIHGSLTEDEVNALNNHSKVKAFVSFTKGEGWGRCLLEQSVCQKPMIVSKWSGHLDFLKIDINPLLEGTIKPVHSSVINNMIVAESKWFTVDYNAAGKKMLDVFKNYPKYVEGAKKQSYISRMNFNLGVMRNKLEGILVDNIKLPAEFVMPKLIKI